MFELIDSQPEIAVPESEYKRLLGYPAGHPLEGRARELAGWARKWYAGHGQPWIYARNARLSLADGALRINEARMASPHLHERLAAARADEAVLVALSAGRQCEEEARRLWREEKPDEYFFLEMYGSAVVESLVTAARARICEWADHHRRAVLPHDSPGYPGWDIADQARLLQMIRGGKGGALAENIRVLGSGMLQPKKSLLAVFGITRRLDLAQNSARLIPCERCSLPGCQYRRVPRRGSPPQIEDVPRLAPAARAVSASKGPSLLTHQCRPAPGDVGRVFMCEYINKFDRSPACP